MKFSYNWLKELVKFQESPQELAEFLTLRAFEVESVEKSVSDWALDIKVLPNRIPDASGHIGMAREIAALKNSKFEYRNPKPIKMAGNSATGILMVKIENSEDCPRYIAQVIHNVKVGQSPKWLKERLETCGLQPINNLVDAANYVMLEYGQPLHVFDYDKIKNVEIQNSKFKIQNKSKIKKTKSKTIIVRRARNGEKLLALDEKTYELNPDMLVIADNQEPIAIAGIKGGKASGVSQETKTIALEAANFGPARIRKGSQLLNLKTDASYRFEHGLDPNMTEDAINRLAALITKLADGEIVAEKIDAYPKKGQPAHILFRTEYANRLLGVKHAPLVYETAFRRIGFPFSKHRLGEYHIEPPTIRRDIGLEEDIIEEAGRVLGYEKIHAEKPLSLLSPAEGNEERFWEERMKDFLVGAGFTEMFRYVFTGERECELFGLDASQLIKMENPIASDYQFLSGTPLPTFIRAAKENEAHEDEIRIFGITKSFSRAMAQKGSPMKGKGTLVKGIDEKKRLAIVCSEKSGAKNADESFFRIKGVIDELFDSLGLSEHWYDDKMSNQLPVASYRFFHPYRVAGIKIDDKKIGMIGELHPVVAERLKLKYRLAAAEIDVELLISLAEKEAEYAPISRFPAILRDIAVIVPEEEKTETVTNIIENTGGKLLIDSDLFDYFQDEAMRKGRKKSLAFHLIFQSPERTLKDEEIDILIKKIVAALEGKEWMVRK